MMSSSVGGASLMMNSRVGGASLMMNFSVGGASLELICQNKKYIIYLVCFLGSKTRCHILVFATNEMDQSYVYSQKTC